MGFFGLLRSFALQQWHSYAVFGAMLVGITSLQVWLPYQIGRIVDGLVSKQLNTTGLAQALGWMLVAAVAIYLLRAGWRLVLFRAVYKLSVQLRTQLFKQLAVQPPSFYQNHRTGDLMAAATNDIDAVELAAGEGALAGFDGLLGLVMVSAMMVVGVDWRLALVAMLPFPFMAYAFKSISQREHKASREALDAFGHLNDHVQESLSGVRTVRALGLMQRNGQQFHKLASVAADKSFWQHRYEASYEPAVGIALASAIALSLGMGSYLVWHSQISIGQLTSFGLYLGQLIWPMFAMGWVMSLIQRGRAAWARLEPVLHAPVAVIDSGSTRQLPLASLRWQGVGFQYPGQSKPALSNIDLHVLPGQTLALVGPTGSGKSTVLKLLLRQWNPEQGNISWGDLPLEQFTLDALRQGIAWVPQEPFLFSASVAHNIALAVPNATPAQIEHAARMAAVHDDIARLPQGYDTPVGERGVTLSGGQRQRVAIARALLTQAPVLLLDDALSAVDTETETTILNHLRAQALESSVQRTVIVVSHRLSSVVHANQIVVLRDGKITEQGQHHSLVAHAGWYARQWHYQQLRASLEAA